MPMEFDIDNFSIDGRQYTQGNSIFNINVVMAPHRWFPLLVKNEDGELTPDELLTAMLFVANLNIRGWRIVGIFRTKDPLAEYEVTATKRKETWHVRLQNQLRDDGSPEGETFINPTADY